MAKSVEEQIISLVNEIKIKDDFEKKVFSRIQEVASCNFIAYSTGVVSGNKYAALVFKKMNPKINYTVLKEDGSYINRGDVIAVINGPVDDILRAEKLALNFIRYMTGISSITSKYKIELQGTKALLSFSDYTNPLLKELAVNAFIDGGGNVDLEKKYYVLTRNIRARFSSYDDAIKALKEIDKSYKPILEVYSIDDFEEAYLSSCDTIRVNSNKKNVYEECAAINRGVKKLEIVTEIDSRSVRGLTKLGYTNIIIPSLTALSNDFPIEMRFYDRVNKNVNEYLNTIGRGKNKKTR